MGILYDEVTELGAVVVELHRHRWLYDYSTSTAERDGQFVGLALDQDGQSGMTEKRVTAWLSKLV